MSKHHLSRLAIAPSTRRKARVGKPRAALLVAGTVVTLVAAGCGSHSTSSTKATSSGSSSSSSQTSTASGGTLTIVQQGPPSTLNPIDSPGAYSQLSDLSYSSLLAVNESTGTYVPELAKSWSFIGTGNKELQIVLRPGAKFSDGTLLTAAAEKQYIEWAVDQSAWPQAGVYKALISKITTPSTYTLDVYFSSPYPDGPEAFTEGLTLGEPVSPKALANGGKDLGYETDGAGPYMLDTAESTTGSLYTYVKNPDYFDPSAQKWTKVVVKVEGNETAAIQAAKTTSDGMTYGDYDSEAAAKAAGLKVINWDPEVYMLIMFDRGNLVPALGKTAVRQALNYAVDRASIASLLHGSADDEIMASTEPDYSASGASYYSFDPTKAKQLLAQAGYSKGFTFSTIVLGTDTDEVDTLELAQKELAQVGVTMKLVTEPTFTDLVAAQDSKRYSAMIFDWTGATPYSDAQALTLPNGNINPWHDSDSTLNALVTKAASESGAQETATWQEYMKAVTASGWFVPMASTPTVFFATDNVSPTLGTTPNPLSF